MAALIRMMPRVLTLARPVAARYAAHHVRGLRMTAVVRLDPDALRSQLSNVNELFAEAREEIGAAMESVGTTYFDEEAEIAQQVTNDTLQAYADLIRDAKPDDAAEIQRSMGLKMEQLKAELDMLKHAEH